MWVIIHMMIAAFVDLNRILHHAKRFTDDIFSGLIGAISIVSALGFSTSTVDVFHYFDAWHPSYDGFRNDDEYSFLATALVSLLLCLRYQLPLAAAQCRRGVDLPLRPALACGSRLFCHGRVGHRVRRLQPLSLRLGEP